MNLNMMPPECSSEIEVHRAKQEFPILGCNGRRKVGFLRSMEATYSGIMVVTPLSCIVVKGKLVRGGN